MSRPNERLLETGIWAVPTGFLARVHVGSTKTKRLAWHEYYPHGTDRKKIRADMAQARATLLKQQAAPVDRHSLTKAVQTYLATADITADTRDRREQQLGWWCAQPAKLGGDVLSVKQVQADAEARERGEKVPDRGHLLGEVSRTQLDVKRLREVLHNAFAPTDPKDPYEFASTHNHYRLALLHLFNELDQDVKPRPDNPLEGIKVRQLRRPELKGQDMRVVAEILKQMEAAHFGRPSLTILRLSVLAWVNITPDQLMRLTLPKDFHDVPDATRDQIVNGAITLTKQPRLKGRKNRALPPPETIPLNPWGVAAMRAYVAEPKAWGTFSLPSVNKSLKLACRRTQAALEKRGVTVVGNRVLDLSEMTLYHLKHSLASAAQAANGGTLDDHGNIQQDPGVSRLLDHTNARTTAIYTEAAANPLARVANCRLSIWLEWLFTQPLRAPSTLRLVNTDSE